MKDRKEATPARVNRPVRKFESGEKESASWDRPRVLDFHRWESVRSPKGEVPGRG
jgi:hypothetical protein